MEMENNLSRKMAQLTMVSGLMVTCKAMVNGFYPLVSTIKEIGLVESCKVTVATLTRTTQSTRANSLTEKEMDTDLTHGQMV